MRAEALVANLAARGLFQGAFVVLDDSRTCSGAHGFADFELAVSFTPTTPSDAGSIAKTMTAAALLQLAADGKLALDDPVRRHLPQYPHAGTRVRHLLAHSAGLPDYDWFDTLFGRGTLRTNAMQLEAVARQGVEPRHAPGSRFSYDNAAYDAAALVIERVASKPYAEVLRHSFFEPLGMRDAFVRPARLADFTAVRTRGYRAATHGLALRDALEGEAFHGGGNVYASARDLARWAFAFSRAALPVAAARREASRRARLDAGSETGLSLSSWYSDADARRHYYVGIHEGFFAFAFWSGGNGPAIGLVSNLQMPGWLQSALPRALVAIVEGRVAEPPEAPSPLVAPPKRATAWRIPGVGEVRIAPAEGRTMSLRAPSGVEYIAYPFGGTWYVPGLDAYIHWTAEDRLVWSTLFVRAAGAPIAAS